MTNELPELLYAKIRVKRSIIPGEIPSNLDLGELAVNIPDKRIWIGNPNSNPDPMLLISPVTGSGPIEISSSNLLSFNPSKIVNNTIPMEKIWTQSIGGDSVGYLRWNGSFWEFSTPQGGTGGGENGYFIDCTYGNFQGDLTIIGGSASTVFCPFSQS